MRNFREKRKFARALESKPFLILLGILIVFSLWSLFGFWQKLAETVKKREMASEKVSALKENKVKLEADISKLQSDRGIEQVLRENYGLSKEGEGVIVVVEDQNKNLESKNQKGGFWSFWQNWFQ